MPYRSAIVPEVFVNGQASKDAKVESIVHSAGGKQLDTCTFTIDDTRPIAKFDATVGTNAEVVVVVSVAGKERVLHWGKVGSVGVSIGPGEKRTYTSRLEHHHFGRPLFGMIERDPRAVALDKSELARRVAQLQKQQIAADRATVNAEPLVFNPEHDGQTDPNMHPEKNTAGVHLFVHEEATRTRYAEQIQNVGQRGPAFWTLRDAIFYCCWATNASQQFVQNPTRAELEEAVGQVELQDFRLRQGLYLPEILDRLLEPYNGTWSIEHVSRTKRKIKLHRRGYGPQRVVKLQAAKETLADTPPLKSNAKRTQLDFTTSAAVNAVHAVGDFHYVESTFELVPAWESRDDTLDVEKLKKSSEEYNSADTVRYQRVWRDWVLNEARDYIGPRTAWKPVPRGHKTFEAYDFQGDFGYALAVRRRRFLPTLTLAAKPIHTGPDSQGTDDGDPIGETGGVYVEISVDSGTTWRPLSEVAAEDPQPVRVLTRECGIRFEGLSPPEFLMNAGDDDTPSIDRVRVRVTATVRGDKRLEYFAASEGGSPCKDTTTASLDCGDRFHWREVSGKSIFWSYLRGRGGQLSAREANDKTKLEQFAKDLVRGWDMADCAGQIVIEGLDGDQFAVGELVTKIEGRAIDLNCRAAKGAARYPQIVSVQYDIDGQQRTLRVQTFRDEVAANA